MRTKRLIRAIVGALALATVLPVLPLNSASAAYGALDTTYGGSGTGYNYLAITDTNIAYAIQASKITASAIDGQGRLVVVGYTSFRSGDERAFALARFNADGTLDTSFGPNQSGFVSMRLSLKDQLSAVAIQPNGGIIVGGWAKTSSWDNWVIGRFDSDGNLDTSFGSAGTGFVQNNPALQSEVTSIATTSTGEIIVAGRSLMDPSVNALYVPTIAKYSSTGAPINAFGNYGNGFETVTVDGFPAGINSITLKANGDIVGAGYASGISTQHLLIISFDSSGQIKSGFGGHGLGYDTTTVASSTTLYKTVALQSDGKIIAAGVRNSGQWGLIARYNSNGTLDSTFGSNGNGFYDFQIQDENPVNAIAIDSNDAIIFGGQTRLGSGNTYFYVGRLSRNGVLDSTFGASQGYFLENLSTFDAVTSIKITQAGEILFAGDSRFNNARSRFAVGRLQAPALPPSSLPVASVPDPIQQSVIETVTVTGETTTSIVLTGKFPEPIVNIVVNQAPIAPTEWQQTPISVTIPEVEPGNYTIQIFNRSVPLLPEQKVTVVKVVPPTPAPAPQVTTEPAPPVKVETPEPVVTPVASNSFKVYFAMASARLDKKSKDSISAWFNEAGVNAKMLKITGYAQATPKGAALDPALSTRRARAVKNFFIELGYSGKFRTSGAGRTTLNNPESRYVEVVTP